VNYFWKLWFSLGVPKYGQPMLNPIRPTANELIAEGKRVIDAELVFLCVYQFSSSHGNRRRGCSKELSTHARAREAQSKGENRSDH
jgi:hypothetical protein